jgi:hypothetical protein
MDADAENNSHWMMRPSSLPHWGTALMRTGWGCALSFPEYSCLTADVIYREHPGPGGLRVYARE